jgi:predicted permease
LTNLLLLFVCLVLGAILQQIKGFPKDAPRVLNALIIYVCLPAITLHYTTELSLNQRQVLPVLMPYILYGVGFGFFAVVSPLVGIDKSSAGALILTAGISSISFVGFPIFELLYGKAGLEIGILMSQAGSFVVCGTLGIITASIYSAKQLSYQGIIRNILSFPPFISFCIALLLNLWGYHFPSLVGEMLQKLGQPFTVLALLSIGLQLSFKREDIRIKPLLYGLLYKLVLAPTLIYILYILILGEHTALGKQCVIGAALGSMNTSTIIAANYGLNPKLATQMVSISIPLSFITVAFWYWLVNFF